MFGDMAAAVWIPLDDVHDSNGTMRVLPGYHTQGTLPRVVDPSQPAFTQSIDDAVMPADLEQRAQTCKPSPPNPDCRTEHSSPADPLRGALDNLRAGQMAMRACPPRPPRAVRFPSRILD